jgi:signal transduction histidine kinase
VITDRERSDEEVRTSQRLLQRVLETIPVGVAVMDSTGAIVLSNPACRRIWGEIVAAPDERYRRYKGYWRTDGRPVEPSEWASARALQKGETSLNELLDIETLDGQRRTIQNSAVPIRDDQDRIVGAVVVMEDVTERVQAEKALRRTQRLLTQAERLGETGSWEQDLVTGEIVDSEENRRLFFGDGSRTYRFEDYAKAVHPDDRDRVLAHRSRALDGDGRGEIEYRVVWLDGSVHHLLSLNHVVRDSTGRAIRTYGTNTDVTRRKAAEDELARRERQQAAVARLSLSALKGDGAQPLFEGAAACVRDTLGVEYGLVLEWVPDKEVMEFRAGAGPWIEEAFAEITVPVRPGSMAWSYMHAQNPVVVGDLVRETRFSPCELLLRHGVRSAIAVPIGGKERAFGVLEANTRTSRTFTDDEVSFVWSLAGVLASAIEQRRAAGELRQKREELRTLSRKLIAAQEAERRLIARELHDDFGQVLTAIKLNLMRTDADANESIALVDGAIARMRDLAQDLRPPMLDELGLEAALRSHVDREARRAGLEAYLDIPQLPRRFTPSLETTCFRVVQEAVTNVIRHAGATRIRCSLRATDSVLTLEVNDNGHGFDPLAARKRADSQGLVGMRERVELAGGELDIESRPGHGTTVRARFDTASDG